MTQQSGLSQPPCVRVGSRSVQQDTSLFTQSVTTLFAYGRPSCPITFSVHAAHAVHLKPRTVLVICRHKLYLATFFLSAPLSSTCTSCCKHFTVFMIKSYSRLSVISSTCTVKSMSSSFENRIFWKSDLSRTRCNVCRHSAILS